MADGALSRRAIAARQNGRKGGLATAKNHNADWLRKRAKAAGENTRSLYGNDFYSHVASQRKIRRGWPLGKLRKATQDMVKAAVEGAQVSTGARAALETMLAQA